MEVNSIQQGSSAQKPELRLWPGTRLSCCAMRHGWQTSATALPVVFVTVLLPTGPGSASSGGPCGLSWPFHVVAARPDNKVNCSFAATVQDIGSSVQFRG